MKDKSPIIKAMRFGVFTNEKDEIMIVHDHPLPNEIEWVDYDQSTNVISVVYLGGQSVDLGIQADPKMLSNLRRGSQVIFCYLSENEIQTTTKRPLIVSL